MIDLRSDTVTLPTSEMYEAICQAPLGDDAYGEDPTVNRLQYRVAELMGMEAALLVPSGTMANLLAIRLYTQPGDGVICEAYTNMYLYGVLAFSSVHPVLIHAQYGHPATEQIEACLDPSGELGLPTRLIALENPHNSAGGTVFPLDQLASVAQLAGARGVPIYLDGSRIFNAAVALGVEVREIARHVDALMFCLSKSLSAPVGSVLCGKRSFIESARKLRALMGGTMRQAGIHAAAGLYALEHLVERLAEDHENAKILARALAPIPGLCVDLETVQTNMVYFDISSTGLDAPQFVELLEKFGVRTVATGRQRVRMVTHRGISQQDIETVIQAVKAMVSTLAV
ncbi:MAG: aminotransferase class I/II-fold pyridoxal phosphate-dependent enzyme [Chloroflexi bacterium]|nr:aminotransferase class I/II-fold pyridoxal phosphate-dependent enzyme [Chloroflexota bacterium]